MIFFLISCNLFTIRGVNHNKKKGSKCFQNKILDFGEKKPPLLIAESYDEQF